MIGVGRETVSSFLLTVQGQDVTQVERSHGSESLTPLSWSFPGSGSHRGGGAISRAGHLEIRRYKGCCSRSPRCGHGSEGLSWEAEAWQGLGQGLTKKIHPTGMSPCGRHAELGLPTTRGQTLNCAVCLWQLAPASVSAHRQGTAGRSARLQAAEQETQWPGPPGRALPGLGEVGTDSGH